MNKKISLGAAIAFALIVAAAVFSVTMVYSQKQYNTTMSLLNEREAMYKKLSEVSQQVALKFYGYASVNAEELQDHLAAGYLAGINDPSAAYYTPADYAKLQRRLEGTSSVGIGAELSVNPDGYLLINKVYPDSPAFTAGLEEGNLVTKVDDIDIISENNVEQLAAISGPDGSKLSLTIRKGGEDTTVELTRRDVATPTVTSRYLPGGIGYLQISAFDQNTSNQFSREYKRLEDKGAIALVIDLRDNESETLESASRIIDRIVPDGPIVRVMDKDGTIKDNEFSDTTELNIPIVTIVNKKTAGAAELFALALKDYGKSSIVGGISAGRAMSTEVIKLSDGSAIEMTVGMYVSPKGNEYQGIGVKPDYEVPLPAGVTAWTDLESKDDPQFLKAVELVSTVLRKDGTFHEEEVTQAALEEAQATANPEETPPVSSEDSTGTTSDGSTISSEESSSDSSESQTESSESEESSETSSAESLESSQ